MFGPSRIEKSLAAEVLWLRAQLEKERQRIDRLTEALAQKSQVPLIMPQAELPVFANRLPAPLEPSSGWFDNRSFVTPQSSGGNSQ